MIAWVQDDRGAWVLLVDGAEAATVRPATVAGRPFWEWTPAPTHGRACASLETLRGKVEKALRLVATTSDFTARGLIRPAAEAR